MKTRPPWTLILGLAVVCAGGFIGGERLSNARPIVATKALNAGTTAGADPRQVASANPMPDAVSGFNALRLYNTVLWYLREEYVDRKDTEDDRKLAYGTIQGLVSYLENPANRFMEPHEAQVFQRAQDGKFDGIGAALTTDHRIENGIQRYVLEVIAPMPDSPAQKAGLRAGDVIDAVNGRWVVSYNVNDDLEPMRKAVRNKKATPADFRKAFDEVTAKLDNAILVPEAVKMLSNPADGELTLTVKRAGAAKPLTVKVHPTTITVNPIDYHVVENKWGYVHVRLINAAAANELRTALQALKPRMKGLVLDLRDNPGGSEASALKLLGSFLPANSVVGEREVHKGDKTRKPMTLSAGVKLDVPIIIITNQGTNNMAEVVAAALRDKGSAKIVGAPSHGDSMAHTAISLPDGSMLQLNTGKYYTPKGQSFAGVGLKPDATAKTDGAYGDPEKDAALKRALQALTKGERR